MYYCRHHIGTIAGRNNPRYDRLHNTRASTLWRRRLHRFNSVVFSVPWKLMHYDFDVYIVSIPSHFLSLGNYSSRLQKRRLQETRMHRDFGIYWKRRRSRMRRNCWFMYQKWKVVLRGTSIFLSEQEIRFSLKVSLQFSSPSFLVSLDSSGIPWLFVLWDSAGILL